MKANKCSARKPKIGTMDFILIIVGVSLWAFTIVMINTFKQQGAVPDTLITCVFAALAGECGIMGWIKTAKEKNKARQEQSKDDEMPMG